MEFSEQIELAEDGLFQSRVRQAAITAAVQIMAETPTAGAEGTHQKRTALASRILSDPTGMQRAWAYAVVTNPAITAESVDSDIQWTINSLWDAMAGVTVALPAPATPLGDRETFQARVRQAAVLAATQIMADKPLNTPEAIAAHQKRTALANRILMEPVTMQRALTYAVVTNAAISEESSDSDIQWTVNSLWDALAGVVLEADR